ncbi:MAG: TRAP transporter small permease [Syntrophothermus sp.]
METLMKLSHYLVKAVEVILGLLVLFIFVLIFGNVIARYVFQQSIVWSEEVTRFLFIWAVFLGSSVGVKRGAHFHVNLLASSLPVSARKFFDYLIAFVVFSFSLVIISQGGKLSAVTMLQTSPVLGIPMGYIYVALPTTGLLNIFFLMTNFAQQRQEERQKAQSGVKQAEADLSGKGGI